MNAPSKDSIEEAARIIDSCPSFEGQLIWKDEVRVVAEALDKYKQEIARLSKLMHPEEMMKHVDCQKEIKFLKSKLEMKHNDWLKAEREITQLKDYLGRNTLAHHLKSSDLYEEIKFLKSRLSKVRNFLKSLLVENISIDNVKEILKEIGE